MKSNYAHPQITIQDNRYNINIRNVFIQILGLGLPYSSISKKQGVIETIALLAYLFDGTGIVGTFYLLESQYFQGLIFCSVLTLWLPYML